MAKSQLDLPAGTATVRVRMVDTSCTLSIKAESFISPVLPRQQYLEVTDQCFLIEHEQSGSKLMFDLGVRKDYWNLPPVVLNRLSQGVAVRSLNVPRDVPELLAANGVALNEISAVVWSHYHWDHIGNMALFPASTALLVGQGFKANDKVMPGYPENATSPVPSNSFTERELIEINFNTTHLTIGGFRAHDYFSDGSLYLLDTPGHCKGHICALARTTAGEESSFVFLGGDICHSAGCFRPSTSFPLPNKDFRRYLCLGDCSSASKQEPLSSDQTHSDGAAQREVDRPMHRISTAPSSAYVQVEAAQDSVEKLMAFDSSPAVLVLIAHDPSLPKYLPTLNQNGSSDLNGWQKEHWKELCRWHFLESQSHDKVTQKEPGFWRDGTLWSDASHELAKSSAGVAGSGL
ncbi:beta-lactamase-like protein [Cadophora sp. MPI-SDFR-AT-0126]|nr:beta-lactamase-like protein [Leptodontidium sp. MPI-SDFR-AT-0119]KAH7379064.1 beta-lactamase-like protein [Leotiomycetes sp. MPI-SDFR-AT-0126]